MQTKDYPHAGWLPTGTEVTKRIAKTQVWTMWFYGIDLNHLTNGPFNEYDELCQSSWKNNFIRLDYIQP